MPFVKFGNQVAHVSFGGEDYVIQVNGKRYAFEFHPYCGPAVLKKNGDPAAKQPNCFLRAASLWAQQGKKVENGLCVWHHEPKEIWKRIIGRHHMFAGYEPAVIGE